jgi:hypothetical protein
MNRTEFYTGITDTYKEAYEIIKKKTNDYASDEHPMHNLELIEQLTQSIDRNAGIFIRMTDKFARLGNLLFSKDSKKEAQVLDESIDDTILDIINYAAILRESLKDRKKNKETQENPLVE